MLKGTPGLSNRHLTLMSKTRLFPSTLRQQRSKSSIPTEGQSVRWEGRSKDGISKSSAFDGAVGSKRLPFGTRQVDQPAFERETGHSKLVEDAGEGSLAFLLVPRLRGKLLMVVCEPLELILLALTGDFVASRTRSSFESQLDEDFYTTGDFHVREFMFVRYILTPF